MSAGTAGTRVIEEFPFTFIIQSFVSGLMVLFFTPLRIVFPSWIVNPFSVEIVTDFLVSIVSIAICSFCLGVPLYFLSVFMTRKSGLNEKTARFLLCVRALLMAKIDITQDTPQEDKSEHKLDEEKKLDKFNKEPIHIEFPKWIEKNALSGFMKHLNNQHSLLVGLIVGSEVSLVLSVSLFWWFISLLERFCYPVPSPIEILVWFFFFPTLILAFSWFCDKYYFREQYNSVWNNVKTKFIEHIEKKESK